MQGNDSKLIKTFGRLTRRNHFGVAGVYWRTILKSIFM